MKNNSQNTLFANEISQGQFLVVNDATLQIDDDEANYDDYLIIPLIHTYTILSSPIFY